MDISVVIATHNQKERLRLVLSALKDQHFSENRLEIIVVDDGSTDGTSAMLSSLQSTGLRVESFAKNSGRCHARNAGIKEACGALVVFLDGDALPAPDLLLRYWQSHQKNGDNAVLCGDQYVLPHLEFLQDPQTGSLFDIPLSCSARKHLTQQRERIIVTEDRVRRDFSSIAAQSSEGGYPFPQVRALQREFHELCTKAPNSPLAWLGLYPHNMAVPLALLKEVGGFDEAIPFCEGWELGYRLKRAGAQFIRARALSYHLYHYHDFSDPAKAKAETAKRYAAVEYLAHTHSDPFVYLIHFWWAHLWPNPFFPEESIIRSLVEFDHLYRTISAQKWQTYRAVLDSLPPFARNKSTRSEEAPSRLGQALKTRHFQSGETSDLASQLIAQGKTHELNGDLVRAEHCYDRAIALANKPGDAEKLAMSCSGKGFIRQLHGDFSAAIDLHTKALRINEKIERKAGAALDLGNLGIAYFLKGDFTTAEKFYRQSKTTYEELGDFSGVANQYNSLANLRKSQGRLDEANELLQRALEIDTEADRQEGLALHYGLSASINLLLGDSERALTHGEASLAANRSLADIKGQAYAHGTLAEVYFQRRDTCSTQSHLLRSIELFERMGMTANTADRYLLLGKLYAQTKEFARAERALRHCLQLLENSPSQQLIAAAKMALSLVHIERQNYAEALREREAVLAIYESANEPQLIAYSLAALGEIHVLQQELDAAESYYRRALSAFEKLGDEVGQAVVYDNMGDAATQRDQKARACALWKLASMRFTRMGMDPPSARADAKIQALQSSPCNPETMPAEAGTV